MIERKILQSKEFMRSFLTTELWDEWLVQEATITGGVTWSVDGHINRDYYKEEIGEDEMPQSDCMPWAKIRPIALSLIRGKRTPLSFRFLLYPPEDPGDPATSSADVKRVCRIRFQEGQLFIASAVDLKNFTLDKEPERAWDGALSRFLDAHSLSYEEQ